LIVVSAQTLEIVARLQTKKAGEGCEAVFSPSGDRILDGTWGGMLATYDVASQTRQLEHSFASAMITSIEPSPSGNISAVVVQPKSSAGLPPGPQHTIHLAEWLSSGLTLRRIDAKFHTIKATAFDRNEDRLAIIRDNGVFPEGGIEVIDVRDGHTISFRACVLSSNGSSICWSPDGGVIGTVENDGFRFYDAASLEEIAHVPWKYPSHIEFTRDGKYLAFGAWSGGEIRSADSVLPKTSAQILAR
jgi:WD40 repeat protein